MSYAGFWKRVAAAFIDAIILMLGGAMCGFLVGILMIGEGINEPEVLEVIGNILGLILGWIYFAAMESSPARGTLGKMALGIMVTDMEGNRVEFARATGRHFGKFISTIILLIGHIMIAFTQKKQGLHDIMARCLVVNKLP